MGKIRLTREEKRVLRLVYYNHDKPNELSDHDYSSYIRSLERKGLVLGKYSVKSIVVDVRISDFGNDYIFYNPKLRNPIDWKWIITTILTAATLVVSARMIIIACSVAR